MVGSWGDIPPPPKRCQERKPISVKLEIIVDTTDFEKAVTHTYARLPLELRKGFFESFRSLISLRSYRTIYVRSGESRFVDGADGAAGYALIPRFYRIEIIGLDELCAAALRAAGIESGN